VWHTSKIDRLNRQLFNENSSCLELHFYLAATGVLSSAAGLRQISECRVLGTSSKAKVDVKSKLLAKRSDEEAQFLEDLATYVIRQR
jgi:hypothetical protein